MRQVGSTCIRAPVTIVTAKPIATVTGIKKVKTTITKHQLETCSNVMGNDKLRRAVVYFFLGTSVGSLLAICQLRKLEVAPASSTT